MASDIFLKAGDIMGESLDARHPDEIVVLSWSWGLMQPGGIAAATGGGVGKVQLSDLSFTHLLDKASPSLMKACATGTHLKEAVLTERKAGGDQQEFLIIRMSDAMVTSVQASASADGAVEQVSLQFARVDLEYKPQRADGSLDVGIHFTYDPKASRVG
jgi:type VI secretion system secreted protein Hcp